MQYRRSLLAVAALLALCLWAPIAVASPWTVADGATVIDVGYDFQFATHEFLPDGEFQRFPLDGQFLSNTLRVGARHGLSDRLELSGVANFKSVVFQADPTILALPEETADLQTARDSILDFNRSAFGAGDVLLTGRYNFLKSALALANELTVKLPTGYEPPAGTFDPETGAVADDVALGDGQTDISDAFLLGIFIPTTRTFARADVGFRLRLGGPGHQVFGSAKVGQFIGKHVLVFAGANGAYTVTEGEVIGQTFVARDFDLTAAEASPDLVEQIDLRLDKDFVNVEGGVLFVVTPGLEIQAAYSRLVVGRNIPAINAISVGTTVKLGSGG